MSVMINGSDLETLKTSLFELAAQNSHWSDSQSEAGQLWLRIQDELQAVDKDIQQQNKIFHTSTIIAESIDTVANTDELLPTLLDLVQEHFTDTPMALYLLDKTGQSLERRASIPLHLPGLPLPETLPIEADSAISQAVKFREATTLADDKSDSWLILPLLSRNEAIGVMAFAQVSALHPNNLTALQTLVTQIANTIQTTRLFAILDEQLEQLATLYHISLQVGSHLNINLQLHEYGLDFDVLLDNLAHLSLQLTRAEGSRVSLKDPDVGQTVMQRAATTSGKIVNGPEEDMDLLALSQHVIETKQAVLGNHWAEHSLGAAYPTQTIVEADVCALMIVPIILRGRCIGTIEVQNYSDSQPFDENRLHILSLLSSQAAVAIENTHLFNQAENNSRFLKTVLEHIPDPIFIKDRNHNLLDMNPANAAIVGRSVDELMGENAYNFFPEDLAEKFHQRDEDVFVKNRPLTFEDEIMWADGLNHIAYTRLIPVPDAQGYPHYLLGISQDITERRTREAERERLLDEMARLYQGSQKIANTLSEKQVFMTLFEQISQENPSEIQAYYFQSVGGEPIWVELKAQWQAGNSQPTPSEVRRYLPDTPEARWLTVSQPVYLADVQNDKRLLDQERVGLLPLNKWASLAILPLVASSQGIGVILIGYDESYHFTDTVAKFWQAMVDQAAVLLANRQLIQEVAYRAVQIETAADVARTASSILEVNQLLDSAVRLIRNRFELYYVGVFLLDKTKLWAVLRAGTGEAGRVQMKNKHRLQIGGESMIGWCIAHQKARIALDVGQEAVYFQNPHLPDTRSEMALPLIYRNEVVGALTVQSVEQAAFNHTDIIFLQTMADQLANAIENARLFEQAQLEILERKRIEQEILRRNNELATINRVNDAITSSLELQSILDAATREIAQIFNARSCGVVLLNPEKTEGVVASEYALSADEPSSVGAVIPVKDNPSTLHILETGQSLIIHEAKTNPLTKPIQILLVERNTENMMIVPLRIKGEVIGSIGLDTTESDRKFTQAEVELVETIAGQVAGAVENANLFEQTEAALAEQKRAEVAIKEREAENRQLLFESQHRSYLLQTGAEVSRMTSSILNEDELIEYAVNLIGKHFDFYYVGLFLLDQAEAWAVLRAGTGEAGQRQLAKNHRLKVGGDSMIGWSVAHRQARIALDVGQEAIHFENPDLPDTCSEMALPLISRNQVIGALTVQSVKREAFSQEDVTLLQIMADQLANAIQNARLFEEAQQAQQEAEERLQETIALQQLSQALSGTLQVTEIFDIFSRACRTILGFDYILMLQVDTEVNQIVDLTGVGVSEDIVQRDRQLQADDLLLEVIAQEETVIIQGADERLAESLYPLDDQADWTRVFSPLTLRQRAIGVVEVGVKGQGVSIPDPHIRLFQAFIDQTALALDNAWQYELSQRNARREALIKEITTRVRASSDIDTILQTTIKEISAAIPGRQAYIQLFPKANGQPQEQKRSEGK